MLADAELRYSLNGGGRMAITCSHIVIADKTLCGRDARDWFKMEDGEPLDRVECLRCTAALSKLRGDA